MAHGGEGNPYVRDLTPFVRAQRARHEEKGSTVAVFLPPQADWELREEFLAHVFDLAEEVFGDRDGWDPAMVAVFGDVLQVDCDDHVYLSTSCLHDEHTYCQSNTGLCGQKTPSVCKFCKAACICPCHVKTPAQQGPAKTEEEEEDLHAFESPEGGLQAAAA